MFDQVAFNKSDKVVFVTGAPDAEYVTKAKGLVSETLTLDSVQQVLELKNGQYNKFLVDNASSAEFLKNGGLEHVAKLLVPGGEVVVSHSGNEKLDTKFLLGGYVDVSESKSESKSENESVVWAGKTPNYESAGKLLPKKEKKEGKSANAVWKLMANDFDDNAYELENEDELLKGDDVQASKTAAAECGPNSGKKRACKNCTCGLRDMEGEPVVTDAELEKSVSGCGNCAKGDAFRCGGCPYLGLPSFTPGTKPEISVKEDGSKVLLDVTSDI